MSDATTVHRIIHRHRLLQLAVRSAAHDLRNIAQALQMSSDVLRGIPDADVSVPALVDDASYRLLELADRLGEMSSKRERTAAPTALLPSLTPLPQLMHNHPGRERLALEVAIASDFPIVNAVPDDLLEVVWELVTNALQASHESTIVNVRISATVNGNNAELVVENDGPGIPAESMRSLFSVIDDGAKELPKIGLAVCRALLRGQGGELELRPGAQTTFVCTVPLWRRP